jgi:site-specific recombinase XerD
MTLSGLHQQFLQYCEVERRMAAQTVTAYRSDFLQFIEFLRQRSRWGQRRASAWRRAAAGKVGGRNNGLCDPV